MVDCPVPYMLSSMSRVPVASAATAGKARVPSLAIRRSRITPAVVDSHPPMTLPSRSGRSACSASIRSPPSSTTRSGPASRARWMCSS